MTGLVRRLAREPDEARLLLARVAAVLRQLPSRGVPIGRLAAECCGDAHALDDGRPVGTLVLSAVRALAGLPFAAEGTADSRRAAKAAVGVHLDDLSSLVLCIGLPGDTRTVVGRVLEQRPSLVSGEVRKLPFSKPIEARCAARREPLLSLCEGCRRVKDARRIGG